MENTNGVNQNKHREGVSHSRLLKIVIAVLVALLIILCGLLVRAYSILKKEHLINLSELSLSAFVTKHGPLTANEVGVIRPWMTFDYVNRTFGLPADFLKTTFGVADPAYPKLTLSYYATEEGFNQMDFLNAIRVAVAHYLISPH